MGDVLLVVGSFSGGRCSFDGIRHYTNEVQAEKEVQIVTPVEFRVDEHQC